jgi:hypothetical protein
VWLEAADKGWAALDHTSQEEAFRLLHGTPEWEAILHQLSVQVP